MGPCQHDSILSDFSIDVEDCYRDMTTDQLKTLLRELEKQENYEYCNQVNEVLKQRLNEEQISKRTEKRGL